MSTTESAENYPAGIDDQVADDVDPAANVPLTDDDQVEEDGTVTLPGNYADCVDAAGREFTVRLTNADRVQWERASRRHSWGPAQDSPHEALTFMAWTAARREGDATGRLTFDQFVDQVPDIEGRRVERVRPTR